MAVIPIFRMPEEMEMTPDLLATFIKQHEDMKSEKYIPLYNAYVNDYDIFDEEINPRKESWKPDNRLAVNFCEYISDTFEGFFIGNPIKITSENQKISEYVNQFNDDNDMDDKNAEVSALASNYGHGYLMAYVDEEGEIRTAYISPMDGFMIYTNGITPKRLYFVRTYTDELTDTTEGSISNGTSVQYFSLDNGDVIFSDERVHGFNGVPVIEFMFNDYRRGIYENVLNLVNEYNKAISEKSNDVDYFADAYLEILGPEVSAAATQYIRDNRVINFTGENAKDIVVQFLSKPDGDTSQEHLLDRLERLIFITAMVCNISDDNFATSSGIALKYRLLPMMNLAKKKERKFIQSLNAFYRMVFSNPLCPLEESDWSQLRYHFTMNIPANIEDEAVAASNLSGITSKKTQLSILSVIDDVDAEMRQIKAEETDELTEYETARTVADTENEETPDDEAESQETD